MKFALLVSLALTLTLSLFYPLEGKRENQLTLNQVILSEGDTLLTPLPNIPGWLNDRFYYAWENNHLFKVDAQTGKSQPLYDRLFSNSLEEKSLSLASANDHTKNYNRFLFLENHTIYIYHTKEKKLETVFLDNQQENGKTSDSTRDQAITIANPTFSPDGDKIAYTLNNDLYVYSLINQKITRLTFTASDTILNGYASWVYYEEILGRSSQYKAFWWSSDSNKIAFMQFDESQVPVFSLFDSTGIYGKIETMRYPKPGYANPQVKLGIIDLTRDNSGLNWIPIADKNDHYLAFPFWNPQGNRLYFQWINRGQDEMKIVVYNCQDKKTSTLYHEKQPAWVDLIETGDIYILNNDDLLLRSSKDGWYHIYYIDGQGNQTATRQLTSGSWSVNKIEHIVENKQEIFFSAYKENSTDLYLYKTNFNGKKIIPLSFSPGCHDVKISPSAVYILDENSTISTPERLDLLDSSGKIIRHIANSATPNFKTYITGDIQLTKIKTSDGYELPVIWYFPPGFAQNQENQTIMKKYPVVLNVYGGPGSALVRNRFNGGYRRGLAKFYLAQQGIIQLYVDHRGTGHFGKKAMALMHRRLGYWEMHDYIDVVNHLKQLPFVDKNKIGIMGHSYGGYVAALALTYGADYFAYGISGSPVIDWQLYDSIYTERFMDTPQENPEGYKKSSVLTYVDRFKGKLRITHGTMDDNVHPQNTFQLLDQLLNTGQTVELMLYPGDRHGIRGKKRLENFSSDVNFWKRCFFQLSD